MAEKWAAFADRGAQLDGELDALGNGSYSTVGGSPLDNGVNLDRYAIAELLVAFATAPTVDQQMKLYCVPAPDGTNYADVSTLQKPAEEHFVASFHTSNNIGPVYLITAMFALPPCKVKFVLLNGSGKVLAASANVMKVYTTNRVAG